MAQWSVTALQAPDKDKTESNNSKTHWRRFRLEEGGMAARSRGGEWVGGVLSPAD